ncbi:Stk1 family PASTA domain-containing Ser/Thr kinase [Tepidimicrobium xylanilyticum]|uniref:Stk1 family PASTA domain-containing Ser/Thr kinase n=1 Tax=Tepidimicrobium xylanilyticum TaxID=1123352 RepID=UPI00264E2718|nr:Stk1 family PASTA domain-containing Ser/Thr kinase [Tepidimicrobium xylanilyticum]GMG97189.1 serine/threonine protein kinase [Tepidimicrobium xylanilyticum]
MIGTVLGNRYEIIEKIGGGGMALVYKAKCRLLNRYVAIKILRDEFNNDEEFIKKFKRESQAAASLSHPNIVNIYDVGVDKKDGQEIHYIVMEYIKGKTLKEIIREKGKFTVDETIDYSIQIAEALEHAHENHIVHRDIKPHNIMVTEDGRVKVTDFGIARAASASTVTNTSNVIGSVHYFSPEQARGGYTDEKSDIYSLGIVMYEMITGRVPFEGDSPITVALKHIQEEIIPPREIDNSIPLGLENIIMHCVKKSQSDRYATVSDLLSDLKKTKLSGGKLPMEDTNFIEAPTQIIPVVEDKEGKEMKKSKKKKNSDGSLKVVFFAILLAFVVVSSMALGFYKLKDYFITKEVVVPDLVGLHIDRAKEEAEKLGLNVEVANEVYSSEFNKDEVVNQMTEAGTKVKEGYIIKVAISKGRNLVKVPNLINRNINEIDSILKDSSLSEGLVEYEYSDNVAENIIINQDPAPYTEVEEGTKINLIVSQGPEKKIVVMPKLVGQSENEAKNALIAYGLALDQIVREPNNEYEEGIVFWQSIEPGNEIETNTAITLYVSSGPSARGEEPEPEEKDKEIPFVMTLTPSVEDDEVEIKIVRVQDGNRKDVYNKIHKVDGSSIEIPLEGKVDAVFEIYYDGIYIDEIVHPHN